MGREYSETQWGGILAVRKFVYNVGLNFNTQKINIMAETLKLKIYHLFIHSYCQ